MNKLKHFGPVADRLRVAKAIRGHNAAEAAVEIGVSESSVHNWCRGGIQPGRDTIGAVEAYIDRAYSGDWRRAGA